MRPILREGDALTERIALRAERGRTAVEGQSFTISTVEIIRLPFWSDSTRGVPNTVLRSALFGAIKRGKRSLNSAVKKGSLETITVIHTGPQLDQADLDVWTQCLHLARDRGLGVEIRFSGHGFLKAIGRATGKSQHEWLKSSLRRLLTSLVELSDGKKAYVGQLLDKLLRDEKTGQHVIELNPKIASIYGMDGWSKVEWEERQLLRRQPLAQWLHGFYSSHAAPYDFKVKSVHGLCGSESKRIDHFRAELRVALEKLGAATNWKCGINDKDLVTIEKKATGSQAKHLREKAWIKARHNTGQSRHSATGRTA